jgi:S-methylmethionine-dependent homocysteine/selenocysteine methylase
VRIAREAAVRVAAELADGRPIRVAGSVAPLEDSYSPDLAPDETAALAEHREHVGHLADAGVDLLLVETMTTIAESRAATAAATETGLETWTSITTDASGERLLSGEPIEAWVESVAPLRPAALLVNCVAPDKARAALGRLVPLAVALGTLPGAYANLGSAELLPGGGFDIAMTPDAYAEATKGLLDAGARIVGGCCGTTPAHTRALRSLLDEQMAAEAAEALAVGPADPAWLALVARAAAMAGGGRALVVGAEGTAEGPAVRAGTLDRYVVIRAGLDELERLPTGGFQLAVGDGTAEALGRLARTLAPGGWLVTPVRGRVDDAVRALSGAGLEIREVSDDGGRPTVLARRPS